MRIQLVIVVFSVFLLNAFSISAQRAITSPTLKDKFEKKVGNLRMSNTIFKLGKIKNNEVRYDTILLLNESQVPMNISLPLKLPSYIRININGSPVAAGGVGYISLIYEASKKNDYGFVIDRIQLNSDDVEMPQKYITVTAIIEEFFTNQQLNDGMNPKAQIPETSFGFGRIKQGEKISHFFKIYNEGKQPLKLHKIKTNNSCIKASFSKKEIAPGDSAIILSEYDSFGKLGKELRYFSLYINDPLSPEVKFEMKGEVIK